MSKKPVILLVDDNKDFLEIFGTKLEKEGCVVVRALGGEEGMEKANSCSPDLVLLDLDMPGENGVEVLSRIHSELKGRPLRVVFLTNYGEPLEDNAAIDKKFAVDIGATDYIKKSEDLDSIVSQVRGVLHI